jgi:hypothetical protein
MSGLGASMAGGNSSAGRRKDDFYATIDTDVTEGLLKRISFGDRKIHECAVGTGEMAEVIKAYGYDVVASDIVDRGYPGTMVIDFRQLAQRAAPVVITNPPFNVAADFIEHGMGQLKLDAMALLLKSTFFHAAKRKPLFVKHPPLFKLDLLWRPDFSGEGSPTMELSWFVWKRGHQGSTTYNLIEKPRVSRLTECYKAS